MFSFRAVFRWPIILWSTVPLPWPCSKCPRVSTVAICRLNDFINAVTYFRKGKKMWTLLPPGNDLYSRLHPLQWSIELQRAYKERRGEDAEAEVNKYFPYFAEGSPCSIFQVVLLDTPTTYKILSYFWVTVFRRKVMPCLFHGTGHIKYVLYCSEYF